MTMQIYSVDVIIYELDKVYKQSAKLISFQKFNCKPASHSPKIKIIKNQLTGKNLEISTGLFGTLRKSITKANRLFSKITKIKNQLTGMNLEFSLLYFAQF